MTHSGYFGTFISIRYLTTDRMRPQIPDDLAKRIEAVYKRAGYGSESELVRDAARRWVKQLEEDFKTQEHIEYPEFEYRVTSNTKLITLTLYPLNESDLRIGDSGGKNRAIPTLYTGTTMITNESLKPALEGLDGVEHGGLTHTGGIEAKIPRETGTDLQRLVAEIFRTIDDVIREKEDPVSQVERTAAKYAVLKEERDE